MINEKIAFDHIPEMGDLTEAVQQGLEGDLSKVSIQETRSPDLFLGRHD